MVERYQLVAGHQALDFVNTLDYRYDPKLRTDLLPDYQSFLAFAEQTGVITHKPRLALLANTPAAAARRRLGQIKELRETLHSLFESVMKGKRPAKSSLEKLNGFLAKATAAEMIEWRSGSFLRSHAHSVETSAAPLWSLLHSAIDVLTSPDSRYIRECGEKTCRWLFLDMSRNHSRRWCDMRICGNRTKARRFYARRRP